MLRACPEEATNIDSREAIDESDRGGSFLVNGVVVFRDAKLSRCIIIFRLRLFVQSFTIKVRVTYLKRVKIFRECVRLDERNILPDP